MLILGKCINDICRHRLFTYISVNLCKCVQVNVYIYVCRSSQDEKDVARHNKLSNCVRSMSSVILRKANNV